eukprot:1159902-Pelagomonas_calceolata.AAC.8
MEWEPSSHTCSSPSRLTCLMFAARPFAQAHLAACPCDPFAVCYSPLCPGSSGNLSMHAGPTPSPILGPRYPAPMSYPAPPVAPAAYRPGGGSMSQGPPAATRTSTRCVT